MSEMREILDRMDRMEQALGEQTRAFDRLAGGLEVRCPNNERRLGDLERKCRNGNGSSRSTWIDPKFLTVALMAIAALATAIAAIYGGH